MRSLLVRRGQHLLWSRLSLQRGRDWIESDGIAGRKNIYERLGFLETCQPCFRDDQ